jgi:hypothetical protein
MLITETPLLFLQKRRGMGFYAEYSLWYIYLRLFLRQHQGILKRMLEVNNHFQFPCLSFKIAANNATTGM